MGNVYVGALLTIEWAGETTRRARLESYRADLAAFLNATFVLTVLLLLLTGLVGGVDGLAGASRRMSLPAIGEPSPVQASQPGPAEKAPLLPWVMSLKSAAAFAA